MSEIRFRVDGLPIPQGSKTVARGGNKVWLRDANAKQLKPWREKVASVARETGQRVEGPVALYLRFVFPRPKSHYGTGRNSDKVKPSAPHWHSVKPDADKLVRAVGDAISDAGLWEDDSRVAHLMVRKVYGSESESPGVEVAIVQVAA